jgi:peptidyl-prolyl cis-trans isomerase D
MLQAMRSKAAGIVVKVLFSVLVLSFAVWGIGDYSFLRHSDDTAVKVGDVKIPSSALESAYRTELDRLRRSFGQIDPETARQFGLMDQVVQRLVNTTLLDKAATSLGMRMGDEVIRGRLFADPSLQGPDGKPDRAKFQQLLYQNNMTEPMFIEQFRKDLARYLVTEALTANTRVPNELVDRLYKYRNEKRSGEMAFVAASSFTDVGKPDDAQLQSIYEDNRERFTAPEYRALTVARVSAEEVKDSIDVDQNQIEEEYQARLPELRTPEKRDVEQLLFADEAAAKTAQAKLASGTDIAAIAKETNQAPDQVKLGTITREDLVPELADVVFALPQGGVSEPAHSPFGWHVFRVTKIVPGKDPTLAEVKDRIAGDLKLRLATDAAYKYATKLEDAVANGAGVEEAARQVGVPAIKVAAVDLRGRTPAGQPVPIFDGVADALTAAFETPQGQDSRLVEGRENAWFIIHVDGVTPSAVKPLADVRDDAIGLWQTEKREEAAKARAEKILETVKGGKTLAAAAAEFAIKVAAVAPAVRSQSPDPRAAVPPEVNARLFSLKLNESGVTPGHEGYHVVTLGGIEPANPTADAAGVEQLRTQLAQQIGSDVVGEYLEALRQRYGVTIDRSVVDRLM